MRLYTVCFTRTPTSAPIHFINDIVKSKTFLGVDKKKEETNKKNCLLNVRYFSFIWKFCPKGRDVSLI